MVFREACYGPRSGRASVPPGTDARRNGPTDVERSETPDYESIAFSPAVNAVISASSIE
jgi:hypothetical protein